VRCIVYVLYSENSPAADARTAFAAEEPAVPGAVPGAVLGEAAAAAGAARAAGGPSGEIEQDSSCRDSSAVSVQPVNSASSGPSGGTTLLTTSMEVQEAEPIAASMRR
jgi:hypothetical protein